MEGRKEGRKEGRQGSVREGVHFSLESSRRGRTNCGVHCTNVAESTVFPLNPTGARPPAPLRRIALMEVSQLTSIERGHLGSTFDSFNNFLRWPPGWLKVDVHLWHFCNYVVKTADASSHPFSSNPSPPPPPPHHHHSLP